MSALRTNRSALVVLAAILSSATTATGQTAVIDEPPLTTRQNQPPPAPAPTTPAFSIAWSVAVDSPLAAPPSSLGSHVFVPLRIGQLLALDRETGRELWRTSVLVQRALAADQGRVIVTTIDSLIALEAANGSVLWRVALKDSAVGPIARGGWVLAGTANGDLLALRGADGQLVWRAAMGAPLQSVPAIEGDRVYVALTDGSLMALDILSGQIVWRKRLASAAGALTIAGDRLFVGCRDNFFYSFDARNGKQHWRWRTAADIPFGAAFDDSRVYFVSLDNLLRALDFGSGSLKWRQPLDTRAIAAPLLVGSQLTVAGLGAELLAFNAVDGTPTGKWTAPAELSVAPLLFGPSEGTFLRAIVVTGDSSGGWRLYGVSPVIEPAPRPLTETPGRQLSPDARPAPRGLPPPAD